LPKSLHFSVKFQQPRKARDTVRLFCFHHAGGGRAMFNAWGRALGPRIEVVPVEVENRERFATLSQLVEVLHGQLRAELDGPHVFFGHSFGALLAYRLACLRAAGDFALPRALFVSSYAPPHLPAPIPAVDDLRLAALLSDLGGMPVELAQWPALRDNAIAATRIDVQLCATDEDADVMPLPCPIYAFGGSDDPLVSERDLYEWRSRTTGEFAVQILRGGHFYLSDGPQLFATLRRQLSEIDGRKC
jgi:surfactin synthase thioesterase subunit